ncbi:MAG TPA: Holliday junction branch migration protein RuvA [Spirochaetota bacterium]|nr:Holliday junction branch migration protein RuvA [Spirochaetota bacterium]HOJ29383.1 Holliday junction branch migration protein RuvA [Spirochaetota bacterium]HOM10360.1 Holliday junction branch migration protein RuvA [Spirochaetota bacterium]HPP49950.1 Holliday junction branch migration protein RuvA [Spirochaetota bacterium]HXK64648.1 Holliday junction branch migration protein RuvA [Spirochaetota bacterium]
MISFLKGNILSCKPTRVVLDVQGVGYEIHIPLSTYEKISTARSTELFIHMVVRENAILLYGFNSEEEQQIFSLLLTISGIGPSIAISILSSMTPQQILSAVKNDQITAFTSIPGIGQSKSEKIIFELKRKLKKLDTILSRESTTTPYMKDAIEALVSLGFDEKQASSTVSSVIAQHSDINNIETIIRLSLKQLSK